MIARPLAELTKNNETFIWLENVQEYFKELKENLSAFPLLKLPHFERDFEVAVDACEQGIGGILKQEGHLVAYESK